MINPFHTIRDKTRHIRFYILLHTVISTYLYMIHKIYSFYHVLEIIIKIVLRSKKIANLNHQNMWFSSISKYKSVLKQNNRCFNPENLQNLDPSPDMFRPRAKI